MTPPKWTFRALAAVGITVIAAAGPAPRADAQQPKAQPKVQPKANPPKAPPIIFHPQINTWPGIPAAQINPPIYNPGPFYNPALNNPWMNQTRFVPTNPVFAPNNPFAPNPFAFNNPFAPPVFMAHPPFGANPFGNPIVPAAFSTTPVAIQQPGQLFWRGPDLQVNPTSGLVYRPLTGVARTADGSTFYHVPGTGLPTFTGAYAPGSGLYFDPAHGTFLNPASGVISKPGTTTVFLPWVHP